MLWAANYIPSLLPSIEWFVMGMQYGFRNGSTNSAVEPQRTGLLMDCLYSQFVNEWAIPLHKGPEAITRLNAWLHGDTAAARIPFEKPRNLYIHAPIEVRVSDSSAATTSPRAFLDPTPADEATLYLNATLYRPYGLDPPCRRRWYEAFEHLMREMGGRPHWAKNFATVTRGHLRDAYGEEMEKWLAVREEVDPEGMFVGAWHRRLLLGEAIETGEAVVGQGGKEEGLRAQAPTVGALAEPHDIMRLEESEKGQKVSRWKGGVEWTGEQARGPSRRPRGYRKVDVKEGSIELVDDEADSFGDLGEDEGVGLLAKIRKDVEAAHLA